MEEVGGVTFIELGPRAQDLTGNVYNQLTVLGPVENNQRNIKWLCQCSCGNQAVVYGSNLKNNKTRSCGCEERQPQMTIEESAPQMDEIVTQRGEMVVGVLGSTDEVSWVAPADLTLDSYLLIANEFQRIQKSIAYWYGDLLNEGEKRFGEAYTQAIPDFGKASETLIKYQQVAARVPREIRRPGLSWTHHFYVAFTDADQRGDLLEMAENMGLSSRDLKEVVKLDYDLRYDLMVAASEGIEREAFDALLNRFKMGVIDKPKKERKPKDDEDDEEGDDEGMDDDVDDGDEDEDTPQKGLDPETVTDWWENAETPVVFCGPNTTIWQGLMVTASLDRWGSPILIWEEVN